jgi:hypothetical protein
MYDDFRAHSSVDSWRFNVVRNKSWLAQRYVVTSAVVWGLERCNMSILARVDVQHSNLIQLSPPRTSGKQYAPGPNNKLTVPLVSRMLHTVSRQKSNNQTLPTIIWLNYPALLSWRGRYGESQLDNVGRKRRVRYPIMRLKP